jgi:hypothetical protein
MEGVEFILGLVTWIRVKPLINTRGVTFSDYTSTRIA